MNSFYLTLPSDSSMDYFPSNTQCCFKVMLPKTLHIGKEQWEVALAQLITPSQFLNISEKEAEFEIITRDVALQKLLIKSTKKLPPVLPIDFTKDENKSPNKWSMKFTFAAGSYTSPSHVLNVINEIIQNMIGDILASNQSALIIEY